MLEDCEGEKSKCRQKYRLNQELQQSVLPWTDVHFFSTIHRPYAQPSYYTNIKYVSH